MNERLLIFYLLHKNCVIGTEKIVSTSNKEVFWGIKKKSRINSENPIVFEETLLNKF